MTTSTAEDRRHRSALQAMAHPGPNSRFHALVLAMVATGIFVLLTAGDMGQMAPLLLAGGLYLVFLALTAEAAFLLRHAVAAGARWRLRQRAVQEHAT